MVKWLISQNRKSRREKDGEGSKDDYYEGKGYKEQGNPMPEFFIAVNPFTVDQNLVNLIG